MCTTIKIRQSLHNLQITPKAKNVPEVSPIVAHSSTSAWLYHVSHNKSEIHVGETVQQLRAFISYIQGQ